MPAHGVFQPHPPPVFYPFLTKSGNYTLAPLLVWVFRHYRLVSNGYR